MNRDTVLIEHIWDLEKYRQVWSTDERSEVF
jgi:hypothetical protein